MATIFDTVFDDAYAAWTNGGAGSDPAKLYWGCNGGYAAGACGTASVAKQVGNYNTPLQAVTGRVMMAYDNPNGLGAPFGRPIMYLSDTYLTPPGTYCNDAGTFIAQLDMIASGTVALTIFRPGGFVGAQVSSAVVELFDGLYRGYQLSLNFLSNTQVEYNVVRENVSILSGAYTSPDPWISGGTFCNGSPVTQAGVSAFQITGQQATVGGPMSTCARAQFDNTVTITSWLGCSQLFPATVANCSNNPHPTGLTLNCANGLFTITGTQLLPFTSLTLRDPDDAVVPYTVVSATTTQIVLDPTPSVVDGEYCVSIS